MSNTPGISPLTTDIEQIRHCDDEAFEKVEHPDVADETEETEDVRIERIKRETIDLA